MFANVKRILALVMVLAMVVAFVPAMSASATTDSYDSALKAVVNGFKSADPSVQLGQEELAAKFEAALAKFNANNEIAEPIPEKSYNSVDAVFAALDALEAEPATKALTEEAFTEKVCDVITASPIYKADSIEVNGSTVLWWTNDGIHCVYNPRMEKISENFIPENSIDEIVNEPIIEEKGGKPTSKQVYLIGPYYGIDENFTDQYKKEASRIASAIGDTDGYTLYSGRSATVDKVAEAVSNGAVVLYDSHGATDYSSGDDYVSGATSSYLCLNSEAGMTYDDYLDGALYGGGEAWVNGATIANHMKKNSPAGISWFATCLSMATNTLANPLRSKGVEVVYGYSQSVTFIGEYCFVDAFWDAFLKNGTSVKDAIASMKARCGNWDLSPEIAVLNGYAASQGYGTISEARADYCAFPIVVSDEDSHPGQRYRTSNWGADIVQTVKSTYTLGDLSGGGTTPPPVDPPAATSYHQQVLQWIRANGASMDDGPALIVFNETSELELYQVLQAVGNNIQIWSLMVGKTSTSIDTLTEVTLVENSSDFKLSFILEFYYYGTLVDRVNATGSFARSGYTKTKEYSSPAGQAGYVSKADATELLNMTLDSMMETWDYNMYKALGFGLKCLGFTKYNGYGPAPCNHTYTNACDPDCNNCGLTRPVNHNYVNGACTVCGAPDPNAPAALPGDMNSDNTINNDDVIALMWHNLFPSQYPLTANTDINHDGTVNNDDVILLMWHNLFPDSYPLS